MRIHSLLTLSLSTLLLLSSPLDLQAEKTNKAEKKPKSVVAFTMKDIDGEDVALSKFRDQVLLIINVASK